MGFAGPGASGSATLLAGIAGLLAGSFSMAAGEYISMSSRREMFQREISLEATELTERPEEERAELVLIYRAKGLAREDAERLADKIMADRTVALDTLAREELGLDPSALGSPWTAASSPSRSALSSWSFHTWSAPEPPRRGHLRRGPPDRGLARVTAGTWRTAQFFNLAHAGAWLHR